VDKERLQLDLTRTTNKVDELAERIEKEMRLLERKKTIGYGVPDDYGQKGFALAVILDEFNAEECVELMTAIRAKLLEYRALREKQQMLRRDIGALDAYKKQLEQAELKALGGQPR
jgi:hypothetical protein